MSTRRAELEQIARRFLMATGNSRPSSDAGVLAQCCGYELCPVRGRGVRLRGRRLYYGWLTRRSTQQRLMGDVVARFALLRAGRPVTRAAVAEIAPMLLKPRTQSEVRKERAAHALLRKMIKLHGLSARGGAGPRAAA